MLAEYGVAAGNAVGGGAGFGGGFSSDWVRSIAGDPTVLILVGVGAAFVFWLFFLR